MISFGLAPMAWEIILRLLSTIFYGPPKGKWDSHGDTSLVEGLAAAVLVGLILLVGFYPFPFIRVIDSGVAPLLGHYVGLG